MIADAAVARDLFARPRVSERYAVRDAAASDELARTFDARLPRDPSYQSRQLVRSSYLAPVDESLPRTSFLRVREYLGDATAPDPGGGSAFVELKHVADDGTKHKERVAAAAGAIEELRRSPTSGTLARVVGADADQAVVERAARLLDSAPHALEPGTEYGRRAWEDAGSTLRVTLDDVARPGTSLARDGAVRRVLELKHAGGALPTWASSAIDDAVAGGRITAIMPGTYPAPARGGSLLRDVVAAARRVATALR